jgi:uncharacterized protein (UPF0335 family)
MNENFKNEWNEQQEYSELFFNFTKVCKFHQMRGDLVAWRYALESKISLVNGILEKEQKQQIQEVLDVLNDITNAYIKSKALKQSLKVSKLTRTLYKLLMYIESEVDSAVNDVMPFLNIKEKSDISGM